MDNVKQNSIKGVKWSAIERYSEQSIRFLVEIIIARILMPADYGLIGIISIFIAIFQSFIDSGFSNALIRKKNLTEIDCSTVFYFNTIVGLVSYLLLFISAPAISEFFNNEFLIPIIRVISLSLIFQSFSVVPIARLARSVDFKTQSKATLISSIISGVIGIVMAYCGYGVWSLVFQNICNMFCKMILLYYFTKWQPLFIFSSESFKELFGFGSKLLLSGLISTIYIQLRKLVIGKYYTSADLGLYTRGEQFAVMPSQNLANIIQRVSYPILSKFQDNTEQMIDIYRKMIKLSSMLIFFLTALLAAISEPLIGTLLTPQWEGAIIFLKIFCFTYMFDQVDLINISLLQVIGRSDLTLRIEIFKKAISIILLLISIPHGVIAICLSGLFYSQIALALNTYYTGKIFKYGWYQQIKDVFPYLLISLASVIPTYSLTYSSLSNIWILVLGTLLSGLLYICLLLIKKDELFNHYVKNEIIKTIHTFFIRKK